MLLPAIAFLKTRVVLLFFPSFFLHSKWPTGGKAAIEPLSYPPRRPLHSLSFSVLTPSPPQPPAESGKQSSLTLFPFPIHILLLLLSSQSPTSEQIPDPPTTQSIQSIHPSVYSTPSPIHPIRSTPPPTAESTFDLTHHIPFHPIQFAFNIFLSLRHRIFAFSKSN